MRAVMKGSMYQASRTHKLTWVLITSKNRSEEHTSELQSQPNLVCRLLLEKKKIHLELGNLADIVPDPIAGPHLSRLLCASPADACLRRTKTHVARRLALRTGGPCKVSYVR